MQVQGSPQRFEDAQAQACALDGWNQDYLQLSAGAFAGEIREARAGGIRVFVERVQQSVWQTGQLPGGMLALGVPLHADGEGMFCGTTCGADALHVFSGASGFEFRSSRQHTMLAIEMPLPQAALPPPRPGAWRMPADALAALRTTLLALFDTAATQPMALDPLAVTAAVGDALLDTIGLACAPATRPGGASGAPWTLVQRARALVHRRPEQIFTVAALCQELGVSRRSLQNAFQQVMGTGPLAYLKAVRMRQARRALLQGSPVTEAATASGFWHFGHFSQDYLAMFGERPSQTLRTAQPLSARRFFST